jgi:hypothetical protein
MENGSQDMHFIRVDKKTFLTCPEDSIDYAVMEKTDAAAVVPLDAGWCDVFSGTARVTNGEKSFLVTENQSTYIPVDRVHALENLGNIPLELVEVQSGSYLGEDDIVRLEDRYGRVE